MSERSIPHRPPPTLERWSLIVLAGFTAISVVGYGHFALNPGNLPSSGPALRFYSVSFGFFAQAHIVLAFGVLATALTRRLGVRWLPALAGVYLLSLGSEHLGTGYGLPFGSYEYTGLLGIRVGPRVPALIPLSWFLMAMPSWVLARAATHGRLGAAIPLGAVGLVLWDLALDPAMSSLTPYWRWDDTGPYYGMPWLNLLGWFGTGLGLMATLAASDAWAGFGRLPARWMATFYGIVLALPLGMLVAAGAWLAVGTTVGAAAAVGLSVRGRSAGVEAGRRARRFETGPRHADTDEAPAEATPGVAAVS